MAPVKGTKKPMKSIEKLVEKPISKTKKSKKKNYTGFSIYLYKLLKSVAKEKLGISKKSMSIMDSFVQDMIEKVASEAGRLVSYGKKTTMTSRDVQAAIKLLIPGELSVHSNIESTKAINNYYKSQERDKAPHL